jgi:hypothetical protein
MTISALEHNQKVAEELEHLLSELERAQDSLGKASESLSKRDYGWALIYTSSTNNRITNLVKRLRPAPTASSKPA